MNLNKQQQHQWQILNAVFEALVEVGVERDILIKQLTPKMNDFEAVLKGDGKLRLALEPKPSLVIVDTSRDSLKLHLDAQPSLTLRSRTEGILFTCNVSYKDVYAHSNQAISSALRSLADQLDEVDFQLCDQQESMDIFEALGVVHKDADDGADELGASDVSEPEDSKAQRDPEPVKAAPSPAKPSAKGKTTAAMAAPEPQAQAIDEEDEGVSLISLYSEDQAGKE